MFALSQLDPQPAVARTRAPLDGGCREVARLRAEQIRGGHFVAALRRRGVPNVRAIDIKPDSAEITWRYSGIPASQFFSGHISGCSRLETGNTLVCEGTSGRLFEVTKRHQVVWEWINPFLNTTKKGDASVSIYRAHRYAPDHPAIADRDLDPARFRKLNDLNGLS